MAKHSSDKDQLTTALTRLASEDRRLLNLSYRSKLSHAEIGRSEGLPVNVVSRRISAAMGALARLLDEDQLRESSQSEVVA